MRFLITILLLLLGFSAIGQEISEIIIQDNEKTKESFIRKILRVQKGQVLDSTSIESDVIRLKRLPSCSHAYFEVIPLEDGNFKLIYGFRENFTIIPSANVFTTNNDEFAFRLGLFEFNAFGRNIIFGGMFQRDIFNSYGINFKAPYLFGKQWGMALNHSNLTTLEPVFFNEGTADYKYNNTSYEAMVLFELNLKHRFEAGINFFNEDYEYQEGIMDPNVPLELDVDKFLYKFIYELNNLDTFYQYVEGFKSTFYFQYVVSSDAVLPDFLIGWNDFLFFKRIGKKGNWANRMRFGVSSNIDSPFAPFAVDNNLNIRGVGNVIDRGTAAIVINTEYRHTLFEKDWFVLQSNVFIDGGSWRNPGGDFGDFGDSENLRIYPGLGVRFIHKRIFNTVFRIDYGYGVTQDATNGFVFGIGQYF